MQPSEALAQEPDFDEFPDSNPKAVWGLRKRKTMEIKQRIEAVRTYDDFLALQESPHYTKEELNWARKKVVSKVERRRLTRMLEEAGEAPRRS